MFNQRYVVCLLALFCAFLTVCSAKKDALISHKVYNYGFYSIIHEKNDDKHCEIPDGNADQFISPKVRKYICDSLNEDFPRIRTDTEEEVRL